VGIYRKGEKFRKGGDGFQWLVRQGKWNNNTGKHGAERTLNKAPGVRRGGVDNRIKRRNQAGHRKNS